jgi:fumarate hydratase class I
MCAGKALPAVWTTPSTKACAGLQPPRQHAARQRGGRPQFPAQEHQGQHPAVIFTEIVPGNTVEVTVAAKGGGSENKSKMYHAQPGDSVVDWVLKTVPTMGAGWCPPGMLGIGIGGTAEKAVLMAKESLMDDLDMYELQAKASSRCGTDTGGSTAPGTVRKSQRTGHRRPGSGRPDHGAGRQDQDVPHPCGQQTVAMIPNCAATRHAHFVMDGSGPVYLTHLQPGHLAQGRLAPDYVKPANGRSEHADQSRSGQLEAGSHPAAQRQDADRPRRRAQAHQDMLAKVRSCQWTSPTASSTTLARLTRSADEAVGPAGPTTATRMDGFTEMMLAQTGLIAMVGKAERGPVAIEAIKNHKSAYLMAVGGAAYLVSKAIKPPRWWVLPTWAWKPFTSSTWLTCR